MSVCPQNLDNYQQMNNNQGQEASVYTITENQRLTNDIESHKLSTLTITALPGFQTAPELSPTSLEATELAALCVTAHRRLVTFAEPITSMGVLYCVGNAKKRRGNCFRYTIGLIVISSLLFHLTMDFLESIWYRHVSTTMLFASILVFQLVLTPWIHLKSIPWALQLLEKGTDPAYVATLSLGRRNALMAVAHIPKSTLFYVLQALVSAVMWLAMLYYEGVIGKEFESFGLLFTIIHAFCTFCTFLLVSGVMMSVQTNSPFPISIAVAPIIFTTELAKAFSIDMEMVSIRAQLDLHVATEKLETAVLRELSKLRSDLREGNKVSNVFCLVTVVSATNMLVLGSVSLVLDANARTRYLLLVVICVGMGLNMLILGIVYGLLMSQEFAKIPITCEEVVAQANWIRLERYFSKIQASFGFKIGGIQVNRGLLVRIFVILLSLGATALQVQLYRS